MPQPKRAQDRTEVRRAWKLRARLREARAVSDEDRSWLADYEKRVGPQPRKPYPTTPSAPKTRALGRGVDALFHPPADEQPRAAALAELASRPFELPGTGPMPTERAEEKPAGGPPVPLPAPAASSAGKCPRCAAQISDGDRFCAACLAPVRIEHCPKCETKLRDGASGCHACGAARLAVAKAPVNSPAPASLVPSGGAAPLPVSPPLGAPSQVWTVGNCEFLVTGADLFSRKLTGVELYSTG